VVVNDHYLFETEGMEERVQVKKIVLVSNSYTP